MLKEFARRTALKLAGAPPDFDPWFYATLYPDLAGRNAAQLLVHYVRHGRAEGRVGSPQALGIKTDVLRRVLPQGFDVDSYRQLNPDLVNALRSGSDLVRHFLEHGLDEGRAYSDFNAVLYRDLYHPEWPLDAARLEQDWRLNPSGRFTAWADMLNVHGFRYGPWVDLIKPQEFATLNGAWAKLVSTRAQAALAFVTEGWRRLAPLAIGMEFDPKFYRQFHPEAAEEPEEVLYRTWLLEGVPLGEPGALPAFLTKLGLPPQQFPEAFLWKAYVTAHPQANGNQAPALAHLVSSGFPREGFGELDRARATFVQHVAAAFGRRGDDSSAIRAFKLAESYAPLPNTARQHLADSYLRQGAYRKALLRYETLIANGQLTYWTLVNAVHCALELDDHQRAFALLAKTKPQLEGEQAWLVTLDDTIKSVFSVATFRAMESYERDDVAAGDLCLMQALETIVAKTSEIAPLGLPFPAEKMNRVVILANQDLQQCTHYRVEQKAELFHALHRSYQIFSTSEVDAFMRALPGASGAIFYRVAAFPEVVKAMLMARTLGVATYYEIDDLIFNETVYPPPMETYGGQVSKNVYNGLRYGTPLIRAAMSLCDYGIASTQPLADQMVPIVRSGRCFVIRNGLDSRNEELLDAPVRIKAEETVTIFYGSGTLAHNSDFLDLAGAALCHLMRSDSRVRLLIVGYLVLGEAFAPFADRIERVEFVADTRKYWSLLERADINLAVLDESLISDCKSEIKWLEAAVFGIPSVVSNTAAYRDVLEDGENVLLAGDANGWQVALTRLSSASALRARIGEAARRKAKTDYGIQAGAASLAKALTLADAQAAAGRERKHNPRILLVNVYFPPQTIGGATRVVRDNVDSWIASGVSNEFDFAVASTDNEAEPAYRSRVDDYRGIPVFRMSTPRKINMDWRPFDEDAGDIFKIWLQAWTPDLVHFHATQRLTASCLRACRELGIPYIVTVHDAWWVSDWPFLVDQDGQLREAMTPLLAPTRTGITPLQSAKRLRELAHELSGAKAVLAVSDTFAKLYQQAGIGNVRSIPNGLPRLNPLPRRPSATGRVRLGHIGGMSVHKGYHLVYAALQKGQFQNLELLIVDHHPRTEPEQQVWGTTPVTIVGKTAQTLIEELYADLDVLLAPSIWPESFGLVTREALAARVWVVASDRGAMGEDVAHGVNGFIIDVSNPDALTAVLTEINENSNRYLREPAIGAALREADAQATQLAELYRAFCAKV